MPTYLSIAKTGDQLGRAVTHRRIRTEETSGNRRDLSHQTINPHARGHRSIN